VTKIEKDSSGCFITLEQDKSQNVLSFDTEKIKKYWENIISKKINPPLCKLFDEIFTEVRNAVNLAKYFKTEFVNHLLNDLPVEKNLKEMFEYYLLEKITMVIDKSRTSTLAFPGMKNRLDILDIIYERIDKPKLLNVFKEKLLSLKDGTVELEKEGATKYFKAAMAKIDFERLRENEEKELDRQLEDLKKSLMCIVEKEIYG